MIRYGTIKNDQLETQALLVGSVKAGGAAAAGAKGDDTGGDSTGAAGGDGPLDGGSLFSSSFC